MRCFLSSCTFAASYFNRVKWPRNTGLDGPQTDTTSSYQRYRPRQQLADDDAANANLDNRLHAFARSMHEDDAGAHDGALESLYERLFDDVDQQQQLERLDDDERTALILDALASLKGTGRDVLVEI